MLIPHLRQPPASLKSADATPLPGGGYFWPLMKVESLQSLVAKNAQVPQLNLVARVLYIHTRANDIKPSRPSSTDVHLVGVQMGESARRGNEVLPEKEGSAPLRWAGLI
jgi:hypothetical protein